MFSKPLSPFEEPKTNKNVFQSEPEVLPCFEMNYKFFKTHKKPLPLATTRKRENPMKTARKMASKVQSNKTKKRQQKKCRGRLSYTKEEINTFDRDVKLSVLSLGYFISFSCATNEVIKGVNYFPSRANDLAI